MKITKIFRVEAGHIVSSTFSDRCRKSHHGHSYIIEATIESDKLDHAGMVLDFGILKGAVREFIDGFDHCYMINKYNEKEYKYFTEANHRWISMPFNSSAEMMSLMILVYVQKILNSHVFNNGEGILTVCDVTVHETSTGRAMSTLEDLKLWRSEWEDMMEFSNGVKEDWSEDLIKILEDPNHKVVIPMPEQNVYTPGFNCQIGQ